MKEIHLDKYKQLGLKIAYYRKLKGYSQESLADALQKSPISVSYTHLVAGVSGTVAKNIVGYREENGAFTSRSQLKKVRGLGPKAFEQCAGFLRVPESKELLDHTAVHPESYAAARGLLARCGLTPEQVRRGEAADLPRRAEEVGFPVLALSLIHI